MHTGQAKTPADSYTPPFDGPPSGKTRYMATQDATQDDGLAVLMGTLCDLPAEEGKQALEAGLVTENMEWQPPVAPPVAAKSHVATVVDGNRDAQFTRMVNAASVNVPMPEIKERHEDLKFIVEDKEFDSREKAQEYALKLRDERVDAVKAKVEASKAAAEEVEVEEEEDDPATGGKRKVKRKVKRSKR